MGAETSQMKNVSIAEKQLAERLRNDVVLYDGRLTNSNQKVSIFEDCCSSKENPFNQYTLDRPLVRAIRNLKIYRHPYSIVKFLGADKILVTEFLIGSLEKNLKKQSEIQICLGLKNILNALIFLVESAKVRHLNISTESIFITENGNWKLNGLEHVFKSSDVTKDFLLKSRPYRNQKALSTDEGDGIGLEQYAFATLCESVISKDSKIPFVNEFLDYCSTHLKHKNAAMRPLLSAIQLHNYFNHDFVIIHGFLSELALKTQPAKQEFFKTLNEKLKQFDENTIGSQLSELLLSRLVLLDPSAQFYFIPFLLKPQNLEDDEEATDGLFSTPAFVKLIVPKLKQVFRVLDVQIRLTLLEHFHLYVNTFSKEELVDEILPQLLLGIKDTNDLLVTKTLLCLADLIPILGASLVIGKNRRKLFADGRPQQTTEVWSNDQPRSITPVMNESMDILLSSSPVDNVDISDYSKDPSKIVVNGVLPSSSYQDDDVTENEDNEDDNEWGWEQETTTEVEVDTIPTTFETEPVTMIEEKSLVSSSPVVKTNLRPKVSDNIDELDIKNQKLTKLEEKQNEVDFFSDFGMAPTFKKSNQIETEIQNFGTENSGFDTKMSNFDTKIPNFDTKTSNFDTKMTNSDTKPTNSITETSNTEPNTIKLETSRLQMSSMELTENDGWGDEDDWNNEEIL